MKNLVIHWRPNPNSWGVVKPDVFEYLTDLEASELYYIYRANKYAEKVEVVEIQS